MTMVIAEFDGRVFVPVEPVDLPVGSKVSISLPPVSRPGKPTVDHRQRWDELMRELNATEAHFPTVEDAIGSIRRRPGYYP